QPAGARAAAPTHPMSGRRPNLDQLVQLSKHSLPVCYLDTGFLDQSAVPCQEGIDVGLPGLEELPEAGAAVPQCLVKAQQQQVVPEPALAEGSRAPQDLTARDDSLDR